MLVDMKKKKLIALMIFTLFFLVACNQNGQANNEPFDDSRFVLAPDLRVNADLDGLVSMEVEVSRNRRRLTERVYNNSPYVVGVDHYFLEYFGGENWLVVPPVEGDGFSFLDDLNTVDPESRWRESLNFTFYDHPNTGRFRWRRTIFIYDPDATPSINPNLHDLVTEFTLE